MKFNLKEAREKASAEVASIKGGCHRMVIVQVAETGEHPAYDPAKGLEQYCAITFENAAGHQVVKTMPLKVSAYSNFQKMLHAIDDDDIADMGGLLGKQLDIEIEENGKFPKIQGFYHIDDEMSGQPEITNHSPLISYSVEEHDPDVVKTLHPQIKAAIASRFVQRRNNHEED